MRKFRGRVAIVLGVVMIALGAFVASRPLWGPPITGSRLMDMGFAALFLLRGFMNLRRI